MSIMFFNFGNDETFHFFEWVSKSGQVDVEALIAEAFKQAETVGLEDMGFKDTCFVVQDCLAELLSTRIEEAVPNVDFDAEIGTVWNEATSLWLPILALALGRISCHAVAQAILMRAGKWAPSKERPTAI